MSARSRLARLVPGIAWRDRRIERLTARVHDAQAERDALREALRDARSDAVAARARATRARAAAKAATDALARPSFGTMLVHLRAYAEIGSAAAMHPYDPVLQMPFKLRNIELARSHGITSARLLAVWPTLDEVALDELPDRFVLKADGGAGGRAVVPLVRVAGGGYRRVDGEDVLTEEDVLGRLRVLGRDGLARPPYFAEELLERLGSDGHPEPGVPDDVKVYCFYGVPVQVLLVRSVDTSRRPTAQRRYVAPDGTDLGEVYPGLTYNHDIPVPTALPDIVAQAVHLSRAVGTPFARVDFLDTAAGVRFGELTRAPGGLQRYVPDHDERMAREWLAAAGRLARDVERGRPTGTVFGPHPYEWHYPQRPWRRPSVACETWCVPDLAGAAGDGPSSPAADAPRPPEAHGG